MSSNVYADGYNDYVKSISKFKPLTLEEEKKNFMLYKSTGNEYYRNKIINSNLKYVVKVANQYKNCGIPIIQLISEGNEGLFIAVEKFDYNKANVKIFSYATHWIKHKISTAVMEEIKRNAQYQEIKNETENDYEDYNNNFYKSHPLFEDKPNRNEEYANIAEQLMVCLDDRELKIIQNLFGIGDNKPKNLKEISKEMEISQERVSEIRDKAMIKMQCLALENNIVAFQ